MSSTTPKWAFKFLVQHRQSVVAFMFEDTARKYAKAVNGMVYDIRTVADYSNSTISFKTT